MSAAGSAWILCNLEVKRLVVVDVEILRVCSKFLVY
jgi:hypothetical protein